MSLKQIQVIADAGHVDTFKSIADKHSVVDYWYSLPRADGRCTFDFLVMPEQRQPIMDALQAVLSGSERIQIIIHSTEAVWPYPRQEEKPASKTQTTREELYSKIEQGARLDSNYLLLVLLSTVVVAIGLIENNVAVVIGAMVIAPLLGPNLALALGTALGDRVLVGRAILTGMSGVGFAFFLSWLLGLFWQGPLDSPELMTRTTVGLDGFALALASGTAAALSITTGVSSVLVGVMVAVALLPPTATAGLMVGSGHYHEAVGAMLLLAVNVVSVNLSAKLVFLLRGVRPRTWLEKKQARQSFILYFIVWGVSLLVISAVILIKLQR